MEPLIMIVALLIDLYVFVLLARVLLPLFGMSRYHPAMQLIFQLTEPVLEPIRRVVPPAGMFDLSPMVAMILLAVLRRVLTGLLG